MSRKHYDLVACRYIGEAVQCGLERYKDRLVVDVDDNLTSALLRDLATAPPKKCAVKRWLYNWRAYAIGFMAQRYLRGVRVSFHSNIAEPMTRKSVYLHNTTMLRKQVPDVNVNTPLRLLIVGWLNFAPNILGTLHFAEQVFPKIKQAVPGATLHIAGRGDQWVIERLNAIDGVQALGYVDDIVEEYHQCRIIIVPIYQGSGTSVKFTEGLMMNRPTVATPLGVRGFESFCKPDSEYLLAESDEEFATKVVYLLQHSNEAQLIARRANAVAQRHISPERFVEIVAQSIRKACKP